MIARINGRKKTKQDLQVCLGEAMLRLGGEVRLGELLRLSELLHLGGEVLLSGSESSETQASGSPRHGFLRLGKDLHLSECFYA